ncbi:Patched family protein [Aphelenchoides avenae]|nr:Patched family protein [Aphelenchus avenae]
MRRLERAFDRYGRFVARHPLPFLIVPCVVTLVSTVGFLNFHSQDDIWDIYAPLNAKSRIEEAALKDFEFMSSANHYRIQILVDRKDEGNLMNLDDLKEIASVNKFVVDNVTAFDGRGIFAYRDMCGIYCNESNALVLGFVQAVMDRRDDSMSLMFTYPFGQALNNRLFLGYSIGNLKFREKNGIELVKEFRLFILHYMACPVDLRVPNGRLLRDDFEDKLLRFFHQASLESRTLNYALLSRNRELEEQRKITTTAIPYLGVTGLVLTVFMIITLFDLPFYKSQHIEALFAVVSPAMALVTTFGIVWAIGFPFSNILTVVPFLVITIGIDDAFLILAGWRHSSSLGDHESRLGESLAKSGASVSVTSITDVLCFGVGIISNMPVVQLFCLYTAIALAIDFVYQVTFFAAVVSYCGKKQMKAGEAYRLRHKQNTEKQATHLSTVDALSNWVQDSLAIGRGSNRVANVGNSSAEKPPLPPPCDANDGSDGFMTYFVDSLHWPWVSIYCCTLVNTDFDMENLYLKESPLTPISQKMQHFVLNESFVVNFVLSDMGSFENPKRRELFNSMIIELESIPRFSMGEKGTNLWIRDFELAANFWAPDDETIWKPTSLLNNYREFNLDEKFIHTTRNERGEEVIDSFSWFITYHNMHSFLEVERLLERRRYILSKFSRWFNVQSHHPLEKVPTESAASAPVNFIQTAVSAMILMSVLVFLFVMNFEAIFSVVISILSICCGTVGYLHLWDVNLDAVSLEKPKHQATSIIVGHESGGKNEVHGLSNIIFRHPPPSSPMQPLPSAEADTYVRLRHTFNGVGWPVIQSGLSTVLGMIPLFFVDAYVVAVFWKTIILVTLLGMYHALFLLPVLFIFLEKIRESCRRWWQKAEEAKRKHNGSRRSSSSGGSTADTTSGGSSN